MATVRRLFSIEPLTGTGAVVRLDPRESHHGCDVLRLRKGDRVIVFDGAGRQFAASVEGLDKKRLVVTLAEPVPPAPETRIPVALYLALVKGDAFESALQHAVELGVAEIVPFVAERSVAMVGRGAALERKIERWRQVLLAATKQCGRARLTTVVAPLSFETAVRRSTADAICLCCAADPQLPRISEALRVLGLSSVPAVAVLIGPEGGLADGEIAAARRNGWHLVSLGPRILRVETASTAALALVVAQLDQM